MVMVKVLCIICVDFNLFKWEMVKVLGVIDFVNLKDYLDMLI